MRRFFIRERPDVVMIDMWSLSQADWLPTVVDAADAVGAAVVVRCCGNLDGDVELRLRGRFNRAAARIDLLITQGGTPPIFDRVPCARFALPEWHTEERVVDPNAVEVLTFLPADTRADAALMLSAFDGLSDQHASSFSLVLAQRFGLEAEAELQRLLDSTHHAGKVSTMIEWLTDLDFDRRVSDADIAVVFDPDVDSRALDAACRRGIPVVLVRHQAAGPGDDYCGATVCPPEPASVLAAIGRANLARRYRYPEQQEFATGASRLSDRLAELVARRTRRISANGRPSALAEPVAVSVVICCYTEVRWDDTLAAASSVLDQSVPAREVLLVVDHNAVLADRLRAHHEQIGWPAELRIIENDTADGGLSATRNLGVASCVGQIVAFLDDDATAAPGWLEEHIRCYDDPNVIGVGGRVDPSWEQPSPSWWPREYDWVVGCTYLGHRADEGEIRNPIGANMSFRRDVLVDSGGFSSILGRVGTKPLGCEETELSIRAKAMLPGSEIRYAPAAVVRHRVPPSRATAQYFIARCYSEGLSKNAVARLAGASAGLHSERAYALKALPAGMVRELRNGRVRCSVMMGGGAVASAAGYVAGMARSRDATHG